jgi:hypothetical protein
MLIFLLAPAHSCLEGIVIGPGIKNNFSPDSHSLSFCRLIYWFKFLPYAPGRLSHCTLKQPYKIVHVIKLCSYPHF